MKREINNELLKWKEDPHRLPLIIRGARQVGKTYTIENFGKESFSSYLGINFELHPEFKSCFDQLDPQYILKHLELLTNQTIIPGQTLLFFDEIQECPQAITSLRYFKELVPELHVIGAGSLLEFILSEENFSYPVGRLQFMYMSPLSFRESLLAGGHSQIDEALKRVTLSNPPSDTVHNHLLKLVKEYFFVGGMPSVLNLYRESHSVLKANRMQMALYQAYKNDFGKYANKARYKYLQILYERAPIIVAKHFQYSKINPEIRSRELKIALEQLSHAGLIHQIFSTSANGLPLQATIREKHFKILFLDIGLLQSALHLDASVWEKDLDQINKGPLAEQFVGQELLAYQDCYLEKKLYFWERVKKSSDAEIDFVATFNSNIVPIEVKGGATGRLRSLRQFMNEKNSKIGIRISTHPLSLENNNILSVPFYLIGEISRILKHL